MILELLIPRSRSAAWPHVRDLALAAGGQADPDGRLVVRLTAAPADLMRAAELWALVSQWTGARLVIDGRPVLPRAGWSVGEVLACAASAGRFTPPARYCASDGGPVPCRFLVHRWAVGPGLTPGALGALVEESGVWACPFAGPMTTAASVEAWLRATAE